jgi:hypothetical protein
LAPPPRSGLAAFAGGTPTVARESAVGETGSAASSVTAKANNVIDPARPTSCKERIKDLETRVATH